MTANYFLLPALKPGSEKITAETIDSQIDSQMVEPATQRPAPLHLGETTPVTVQWFNPAQHKYDNRPRQWTPEARAASEFLGHSMEYLAYTRKLPSGRFTGLDAQDPDTEAILILMEAKRHVYQTCPYLERRRGNLFGWKGQERRKPRPH